MQRNNAIDYKTRLNYYLGSRLSGCRRHIHISPTHPNFCSISDLAPDKRREGGLSCLGDYAYSRYDAPLYSLVRRLAPSATCMLYAGSDRVGPDHGPVFVKNRREASEPVILKCLNQQRHWTRSIDDIPFEDKDDTLFWRGITSGWEYRAGSRMDLVKRWGGRRSDIDVGFSGLAQEYELPGVRERWIPHVRGPSPKKEFFRHKYIMSVEGNDKDSGLGWKLSSNSLVMMTKPVCESWIMEPFLKPFVHYVPLAASYEDLADQLTWCRNHPGKCMEIIHNANAYMKQFDDIEKERKLEDNVVLTYFDRVRAWKQNTFVTASA